MEIEAYADHVLLLARSYRTSDIHILPEQREYHIYFRLNGQMKCYFQLKKDEGARLISYFKFRSNMDVGEKRRPQSGSLVYQINDDEEIDLRLSTISNYRTEESLVIRLLEKQHKKEMVNQCFFSYELNQLKKLVQYKSGLILFSGPVDSGKTTTMYNLVKQQIRQEKHQVISIEDPVEIEETDFLQVQVNEAAGISYETLLKSTLRHHPDIIIVGEIRDEETAKMVIRGALTGHLIIASVHAKNASGVVSRLEELGVSRDALFQTIIGIVFQKLLPVYCDLCEGQCHSNCTHYDQSQKRIVLYDVRVQKSLEQLFQLDDKHVGNHVNRTFNHLLKKVLSCGFISSKTYQRYQIP